MTWDYYIFIEQEIRSQTQNLSDLETRFETSDWQQRRKIKKEIDQELERLRESWRQVVDNDPALILVAPFLDHVSVWWFGENFPQKEKARTEIYMPIVRGLTIDDPGKVSDDLNFRPDFQNLPVSSWLGLEADFELLTPWYSKDDRVFHLLDNPVRQERIFGVPLMAASSWKGMLRWAFRMCTKLIGSEQEPDEDKRKQARTWELHLFGNEKGEEKNFHQGALVFYPTWFDKIGFEVINPHSRERRAGTQPIYYEVVPPGAKGTLSLLYAPWPGMKPSANPAEVLEKLLEAIEQLLTTYGISAERTVGWGTAKILKWRAFHKTHGSVEKDTRTDLWQEVKDWLPGGSTP